MFEGRIGWGIWGRGGLGCFGGGGGRCGGGERGGVERICGTDTAVVRSIPIGNQRADKTLLVE